MHAVKNGKPTNCVHHPKSQQGESALGKIIGESAAITEVKARIKRISQFPGIPVLITGETGTGKELVVDALHACSPLAAKPLVKVNCAAIPENLLESHLFGHRRGAFSGALSDQKGLVEEAQGGVLFLDEICSLKMELQPKLLRFLENGSYLPVGETQERHSNTWVVAATNQNLNELVDIRRFRADLFFRLKSSSLRLPLLRERTADIHLLADHFLTAFAQRFNIEPKTVSLETHTVLTNHSWPGNVRELKYMMAELAIQVSDTVICPVHIMSYLCLPDVPTYHKEIKPLKEIERIHILMAMRSTGGRVRKTAELLGIDRNTLKKKLTDHGLKVHPAG